MRSALGEKFGAIHQLADSLQVWPRNFQKATYDQLPERSRVLKHITRQM